MSSSHSLSFNQEKIFFSAIKEQNTTLAIQILSQADFKISLETLSSEHKTLIFRYRNPNILQKFMEKFPEGIAVAKNLSNSDTWLTILAHARHDSVNNIKCLELILNNTVYQSALLNEPGENGLTPLQWAVKRGNWDKVNALLECDPKMDLETYKKIVNVDSLKQEQRQALIDKCNHTTDGANYFLELSLTENKKKSIATLQCAIHTWQEQMLATEKVKVAKVLQSCIRGGLGVQNVKIMKDISMTHKDDYANAESSLGKMIYEGNEDAATKYILEYKNPKIKNHLLNIIFTDFNHPLSLLYFAGKDRVKIGTYQNKNIKKLSHSYWPKERRGLIIKSSIFSIYSPYFTAQSCGVIPAFVGIGPQAYFQQKDAKQAEKQAKKARELAAQKVSAATTIQKGKKESAEEAAEERIVATQIAESIEGITLTIFKK